MKVICTLLLLILCIGSSFAQKQDNQWYFGNYAGLNFNSGASVAILTSQISTSEGSASIADKTSGNLLFYTDGTDAWDATNHIMPSCYFMGGNPSTTQSAVIVPKPGSSTIYYVFTLDDQAGFYDPPGDGGLNCNIVDMSLNGGLGDLTTQDSLMLTPTTEKFSTTLACNGTDVWLVVHQWNSNAFYAYLITANGIQAPVISYTGIVHEDVGSGANAESIGYMRISTDGKKLALACYEALNTVQIFDFDNSTGIVSNPITDTNYPNTSGDDGPYGVCFSPDNSKLYVSYIGRSPNPSQLFQYNMLAGSSSAILASRTAVGSDYVNIYGGIQQAPDGKLYVARYGADSISAITNPNALGTACNYVANYLFLGVAGYSTLGLPEIIPNYINAGSGGSDSVSPQYPVVCSGDSVILIAAGGTSYAWSPAEGLSATTGDTVVANPTASVTYTVTITGSGGCSSGGVVTDVVTISPAPNKPIITPSVTGDTLFSSARNGNQWFENDTLKKGATDSILVITGQPKGIYKVVVTDIANGCNTTSDPYSSGINLLGINSNQVSIYPNPTNSSINIKICTAAIGVKNWRLQLVDVLGRTLYTRQSLNYNNKIDVSNLPDGMYFITISNATNRAVFPVVKQN